MLGMNPPQNRTGGCRVDWPFSEVDGFERYVGICWLCEWVHPLEVCVGENGQEYYLKQAPHS